ncbi:MAG TPA: two-component regulator propeller domain-containing protein, partial [Burkholderiaceae bacterium]|nr:two-component regulator propeller domain-containing protein [Burkholderiaceae bacterium]
MGACLAWLIGQALLFTPAAQAQQRSFQYFTQAQGLGNLVVNTLAQDRRGFLWVGTENGAYRFDGGSFVGFGDKEGLLSQTINVLHVDAGDRVWAGTDAELYVRQEGRFVPVRMDGRPLPVLIGDSILSSPDGGVIAVSRGRLIAITPGEAGWSARPFFTAGQIEAQPALKEVHGAFVGRGGVLWLACRNALCRVDGERIQVRPLPTGDVDGAFASVLEDSHGSVWVRSNDRLLQLRPGTETFVQHAVPGRADVVGTARPLAEDALGRILTFSGYG